MKKFIRQTMSLAKGHSAEPPCLHAEGSIKEVVGNMGSKGTMAELRAAVAIVQKGKSVEAAFSRCTGLKPRFSAPKPPTDHTPEILSIALRIHSMGALRIVPDGNGRLRTLTNVPIHPTAGSASSTERRELFTLQEMREARATNRTRLHALALNAADPESLDAFIETRTSEETRN